MDFNIQEFSEETNPLLNENGLEFSIEEVVEEVNITIEEYHGADGVKGDKGDKGDKGEKGEQGIQGIQGVQGIQGEKGDKGDKGEKGDSGGTTVTKTSDLTNDGEDGIHPFITAEDIPPSLPEGATLGDVLVEGASGVEWSNRLTYVENEIDAEIVNRALADNALQSQITTEKNRNDTQDGQIAGKLDKPTVTSDFTTYPNIVAVDGAGNPAMVSAGGTNFMALLFADNAKWFFPNSNAATYSFFRANSGNIALQGQTAKANGQAMPGIVYTSSGATLAFQRGAPMAFRNETAWKFVRKFEINTAVSGQRVLVALSNGYVSTAPTNVAMSTLIQLVGICMQNSSNNIFVINNDGSGTAVLTDTGYTNDINCYYLLTITKNIAGTLMTVKLDKYSNTTGYISSYSQDITTDFPTSTLLYPAIWCVDSATTSAVIVTDYGSYEEQRLAGI